jgi:hypothetical protein
MAEYFKNEENYSAVMKEGYKRLPTGYPTDQLIGS